MGLRKKKLKSGKKIPIYREGSLVDVKTIATYEQEGGSGWTLCKAVRAGSGGSLRPRGLVQGPLRRDSVKASPCRS